MKRLTSTISVIMFLCCSLIPIHSAAQRNAQTPPAVTKEQWREDLRYFARELPRRHKNLYHATSREQFERAFAENEPRTRPCAGAKPPEFHPAFNRGMLPE